MKLKMIEGAKRSHEGACSINLNVKSGTIHLSKMAASKTEFTSGVKVGFFNDEETNDLYFTLVENTDNCVVLRSKDNGALCGNNSSLVRSIIERSQIIIPDGKNSVSMIVSEEPTNLSGSIFWPVITRSAK